MGARMSGEAKVLGRDPASRRLKNRRRSTQNAGAKVA